MAMADGPARHTDLDPLDDEWEKFQANGCPDWWLLAKYVGQAARSFPYQPFRGMSTAGGVTELDGRATDGLRAEQASGVELQQCASHGSNEQHQQVLTAATAHSMQPSCHTGKEPAAGAGAPAASTTAGQGGLPDALPTLPCRAESGTAAAAAAPMTSCGLKGIFGCNGGCTPACTASHTADQMG